MSNTFFFPCIVLRSIKFTSACGANIEAYIDDMGSVLHDEPHLKQRFKKCSYQFLQIRNSEWIKFCK